MTSFTEQELTRTQAVVRIADRAASQQTISDRCGIASPAVFEILGSDRIVITSLTSRGHVTSLHGHMTWIPHRPFPIGGPLERISLYL